jgi:hypothetical protein
MLEPDMTTAVHGLRRWPERPENRACNAFRRHRAAAKPGTLQTSQRSTTTHLNHNSSSKIRGQRALNERCPIASNGIGSLRKIYAGGAKHAP